MRFRVVTLNLEQNHKRWHTRCPLIIEELARLKADIIALNEVSVPIQSARLLQQAVSKRRGMEFKLLQQTRVNSLSQVEGEALLTHFEVIETGNLDYRARDMVAQVARIVLNGNPLDVYVTHLYMSRGDDSLRLYQVQELLSWIESRGDISDRIVCGDFNAVLEKPSAALMATQFRPTQTEPTAFTPLADEHGSISHPYWPRMDRCIDYIWVSSKLGIIDSGICFNQPSPEDSSLWPSDHAGVWADLEIS
jgi:endonuclease/exonuclease/phosphatase family metal-dependent hydrolase